MKCANDDDNLLANVFSAYKRGIMITEERKERN